MGYEPWTDCLTPLTPLPTLCPDMQSTASIEKVNLAQKLALFDDHWNPKIAGELNDSFVKLVKLKGEFVWHHHEAEDELFLVINDNEEGSDLSLLTFERKGQWNVNELKPDPSCLVPFSLRG